MRRMRTRLHLVFLLALAACTAGTAENLGDSGDGGAGARAVDPCDTFLSRVCGSTNASDAACNGMAACTAAQLTATYEHASCAARNMDEDHYQTCPFNDGGAPLGTPPPQACDDLRTKACGVPDGMGSSPCATDDGCLAASEVANAADTDLCVQALGDNTSYPRCL